MHFAGTLVERHNMRRQRLVRYEISDYNVGKDGLSNIHK